jgi:putative MATE family efflux protein
MSMGRFRKINHNIIEGGLRSSLWKLAMPMIVGAVLHDLFTLADLFFVGRLGHLAVAALSISGVIIAVIIMVAIGISVGATALIAHFMGRKDYDSADNVLFQTVVISVVCSVGMVLIGLFGTTGLLRIFGADPKIIPAASEYLRISFVWSIFIFLFIGFDQALKGSGDAIVPLRILVLANLLNIALDPLLIFGLGFFPRMGVAGSAAATIISRLVGVAVLLWHFFYGRSSLHFHKRVLRVNLPIIGRIVKIGFFASFEVLLRQLSLLMLLRLVTFFGTSCLAAFGIAIRIRMAVMMLGFGMGSACAVLIGQNMGADRPDRAFRSGKEALKYYELMVVPIAVVLFVFSSYIIGFFNNYPEVVEIGSSFLRFIAVTLPFLAMALILGRGITGAGDTIAPAVMTGVVQLGLRIPVSYVLALVIGLGANGIWLGINASDVFQGLAMAWYFKQGYWQKRYHKHRAVLEQEALVAA